MRHSITYNLSNKVLRKIDRLFSLDMPVNFYVI
jgi:hypothetical protein